MDDTKCLLCNSELSDSSKVFYKMRKPLVQEMLARGEKLAEAPHHLARLLNLAQADNTHPFVVSVRKWLDNYAVALVAYEGSEKENDG